MGLWQQEVREPLLQTFCSPLALFGHLNILAYGESGELRKENDDDDSHFPPTLAYQTALVSPSHVYCHDCPFKSHFGTRLSVPAIGRLQMEEDCSCLDLMEGEKEKKKRPGEALRAEINVSCQCTSRSQCPLLPERID